MGCIRMPDPLEKKIERLRRDIHVAPCHCVGPQNGEPLCPCRMRMVVKRDGRYILPEQDLGPVIDHPRQIQDWDSREY